MKLKEADKIVVAKPVPSRPTNYTNYGSYSELLAGAINASPSNMYIENTFFPIRPKTIRLKPIVTNVSQAETSNAATCGPSDNSEKVSNNERKSNVIYKPLAKVVSMKTCSMLANLGNYNLSHPQATISHVEEARVQPSNHYNCNFQIDDKQVSSSEIGKIKSPNPSNNQSINTENDQKNRPASVNTDQASYDGYNWRKYGQKQVKGSEYPRSYYKCTYPNCPVKKMVERSFDGKIAEIVYKGEHNHSKPQPAKRNTNSSRGQGLVPDENSDKKSENENFSETKMENYSGKGVLVYDNVATCPPENSFGVQGDCDEAEVDEPKKKKRKMDTEASERVDEVRVMVPNPSIDTEIIGDGFRWRKYGQKVVKGNPYPRSYYRCTSLNCNVRKHVERAIDDPTSFVTTYEGKHNHEIPTKNPSVTPSESNSQATISKDKL